MNFQTFCTTRFDDNESLAIKQLAYEAYHHQYTYTQDKHSLKHILDTMSEEQANRCTAERRKLMHDNHPDSDSSNHPTSGFRFALGIVFIAFFFICTVYLFITGWINIAARNELKDTGVQVDVTVVQKEYDSFGEYYDYTFSYSLDGERYSFKDSPDRDYDVGDTFTEYIHPDNPQVLTLSSSNMAFSFLFFWFAVGSLLLSKAHKWLKKHLLHILLGWEAAMITVGLLLRASAFTVIGTLLLITTLLIWLYRYKKKHQS